MMHFQLKIHYITRLEMFKYLHFVIFNYKINLIHIIFEWNSYTKYVEAYVLFNFNYKKKYQKEPIQIIRNKT